MRNQKWENYVGMLQIKYIHIDVLFNYLLIFRRHCFENPEFEECAIVYARINQVQEQTEQTDE
jgi:hypothetical protein